MKWTVTTTLSLLLRQYAKTHLRYRHKVQRKLKRHKDNTETVHITIVSIKSVHTLQKLSTSYTFTLTMDLLLTAFVNIEEKKKTTKKTQSRWRMYHFPSTSFNNSHLGLPVLYSNSLCPSSLPFINAQSFEKELGKCTLFRSLKYTTGIYLNTQINSSRSNACKWPSY